MGGGDSKRTSFPWLGSARYVVAALVTAITVATVIIAIHVVLRPAELELSIANGAVYIERPEAKPSVMKYKLTLRAYNPSGRAVIHYNDDNLVRLLDGNSLELTAFSLGRFVVPQQAAHYVTTVGLLNSSAVSALAERLYNGDSDTVLVYAQAFLSFTIAGANSTHRKNITFNCWPVSIGSFYAMSNPDVSCTTLQTPSPVAPLKEPTCYGGCPPPEQQPNCSSKG